MSKENRVSDLEQKKSCDEDMTLSGCMYFGPEEIIVDGVTYSAIEDVPQELRLKYEGAIAVGQVETRDGRTAEVVA